MLRRSARERRALYELAVEHITESISDPDFDVRGLAGRLDVSIRQLQRVLASEGETTFNALLAETRMRRAYELMVVQGWSARAAAPEVGYSQPAYLSKRFRRRFGIAPQEARRRRRDGAAADKDALAPLRFGSGA